MNFLKLLNPSLAGSDGHGADGSSRSRSRPQPRPEAIQASQQLQMLLVQVEARALVEDKKQAMEEVSEIARKYPDAPLDGESVRALLSVAQSIQSDRHSTANVDLTVMALEVLKTMLTPPHMQQQAVSQTEADESTAASALAAHSATHAALVSLFVSHTSHLATLLELLEERGSVVKLYTMQLLTSLLLSRRDKVQSLILSHPQGVTRMVELLSDHAEVVRNEALLLLEALTDSNPAIQKIVAFNGAFEKLLNIAEEESSAGMSASIIAEDALRLVASLLADNTSNQFLFLEQGSVKRCIPYLKFREGDDAEPDSSSSGNATGNDSSFQFLLLTMEIITHAMSCIDRSPSASAVHGSASASSTGSGGATNAAISKNSSARTSLGMLLVPLLELVSGHICSNVDASRNRRRDTSASSSASSSRQCPPPVALRREVWSLIATLIEEHNRNQLILEQTRVELEAEVEEEVEEESASARAPQQSPYSMQQHQTQPQMQLQYPQYPYDPVHNPYVPVPSADGSSVPPDASVAPVPQPSAAPPHRYVVRRRRRVRRSALRFLLDLSVDSTDAVERRLLLHVLKSFFSANARSQLAAIMSFAPSPNALAMEGRAQRRRQRQQMGYDDGQDSEEDEEETLDEDPTDGIAIGPHLIALLRATRPMPAAAASSASNPSSAPSYSFSFIVGPDGSDFAERCRFVSSEVLRSMVQGNSDAQMMLLQIPVAITQGASSTLTPSQPQQPDPDRKVLDYFIEAIYASQGRYIAEVGLLNYLCCWSDGCQLVNELIFGKYASGLLAYIVQMIRDPLVHPLTAGLATYYIALVLELISTPVSVDGRKGSDGDGRSTRPFQSSILTPSLLLDVISKQIGLERFKDALTKLANSTAFKHAAERAKNNKPDDVLAVWKEIEENASQQQQQQRNDHQLQPQQDVHTADMAGQPTGDSAATSIDEFHLLSDWHDRVTFDHSFVVRFQSVFDRCDQRLLVLFTSAAATPQLPPTAAAPAAIAPQPTSTMLAAPSQSALQSASPFQPSPAAPSSSPQQSALISAATVTSSAIANSQLEQELSALREENARLKQENGVLKSSADGHTQQVMDKLNQLQQELSTSKRQLQQAQQELQYLCSTHATPSTASTSRRSSSASASGATRNNTSSNAEQELADLRAQYQELESMHNDLLILLAQQDIEIRQLKGEKIDDGEEINTNTNQSSTTAAVLDTNTMVTALLQPSSTPPTAPPSTVSSSSSTSVAPPTNLPLAPLDDNKAQQTSAPTGLSTPASTSSSQHSFTPSSSATSTYHTMGSDSSRSQYNSMGSNGSAAAASTPQKPQQPQDVRQYFQSPVAPTSFPSTSPSHMSAYTSTPSTNVPSTHPDGYNPQLTAPISASTFTPASASNPSFASPSASVSAATSSASSTPLSDATKSLYGSNGAQTTATTPQKQQQTQQPSYQTYYHSQSAFPTNTPASYAPTYTASYASNGFSNGGSNGYGMWNPNSASSSTYDGSASRQGTDEVDLR